MKLLLILTFAFTLFNTGLIWTIQVVHYPGFLKIGNDLYGSYQQFHMRAITMVVGPSMLAELIFSGLLLLSFGQLADQKLLYILSVILLAAIWIHTAIWASPLHGKLLDGFNPSLIRQLIYANWWRTVAWSIRAILLGLIVYSLLDLPAKTGTPQ